MKELISSAGLLHLYLNGYEEDGMLYTQQVNTYNHIEDGFYQQLMKTAEEADKDTKVVHIFAVAGIKEKVNQVLSIIEDELKSNYQRLLSGKKIIKASSKLDKTGNIFHRCVQEFFCEQPGHFPKRMYYDYDDFIVGGICCNHVSNEIGDSVINGICSLWLERESPALCGKQLMIRSFFMRDFIGRKVVAALPETQTGAWRLLFEGGHQVLLSEEAPYMKETLHPDDLQAFCSSNLQSILLNPIYSYGKWFLPNDICEEWHKAFIYLCAVSDKEWDVPGISKVYEHFLSILEKNICTTMNAPPFISKEQYWNILLQYIHDFRKFLKGDDEPVISKDMYQTINTRYVYLPYLWQLVDIQMPQQRFLASEFHELINHAVGEKDTYKKGTLWEDTAAYMLSNVEGFKITGRRIRAGAQEIDLSVVNTSLDDEIWQLGAYILVECKNWTTHVNIHQIRNIAHISNMKGNKTAILFASNGLTEDAQEEISRLASEHLYIVCLTADELLQLNSAQECKDLIIAKWLYLQNSVDLASVI